MVQIGYQRERSCILEAQAWLEQAILSRFQHTACGLPHDPAWRVSVVTAAKQDCQCGGLRFGAWVPIDGETHLVTISNSIFRILDANANRASEALRVIEESTRFAQNDSFLAVRCKSSRHELNAIVADARSRFPLELARDTVGDVGTNFSTTDEAARESIDDILRANFARLKEALRCLEEYSKPLEENLASRFEQLRYSVYTLERAILSAEYALQRLADAKLYAILDGCPSEPEFVALIASLVDAVDLIQLRDKQLNDVELFSRAKLLAQACRGRCLSIINDRPDLAVAAGADGVHLGQADLPPAVARDICGPGAIIGVSTHSIEQARAAVLDGATYIGAGPVFPSRTKDFERLAGIPLVAQVAQEIDLPAFAIGGIDDHNVDQVIEAGMRRVAMSAFLTAHADPAVAASSIRKRLE